MIAGWAVLLSALVYLCFLFAVAHWGDQSGRRLMEGPAGATVYALSLAVYCTSWTFFGSVGLASVAGADFLTIYIGPVLVIGCAFPLVRRLVGIAKDQNITSIADFLAARYGKSERVAAIVCFLAVLAAIPYIALQLKAVSASLQVFLEPVRPGVSAASLPFGDLALVVALVLAGFTMAFGTRHADATEHQDGLTIAVALESVVKLAAFLAVGAFVTWRLVGTGEVSQLAANARELLARTSPPGSFLTLIVVSAAAAILLPRQFHMLVVENRALADVNRAAWLFPLYLVLINLFVIPLALAGRSAFAPGEIDPDMAVLALPLKEGADLIAVAAFLGGLSAATAMVIVEALAVAIMISNHLVIPLVLRRASSAPARTRDLGQLVLGVRRLAIVVVVLLAYMYYRAAGDAALAAIGLLSFAAIAQIGPAFVGGLFWSRGTALGATAGLTVGLAVWAYTLLLPSLLGDATAWAALFDTGPFGVADLKPTGLFGFDMPRFTHGVVWSVGLNILAFVGFSLLRAPTAVERLQATAFGVRTAPIGPRLRILRGRITVGELRATVARYLGEDRAERSFASFLAGRGAGSLPDDADADPHLLRYAEHLLASAIGAASARLALSLLLRRGNLSTSAALKLLDDASAAIQHSRDLLQHALDHARQGITVLDRNLELVAWNRAFVELYDLPPEFVRIGVPLIDIVRFNARRGAYGPGPVEELAAERLDALLRGEEAQRLRLAPSGRVIEIRSNTLPDGGLVATYTDVTDTVAAEEARERLNEMLEQRVRQRTEELLRLNEALTRAKAEAEEANASKTQFLAAASHDLLQPLNAARLYATTLVERDRGGGDPALAENVDASLDAVEDILTALLDISRLDSGAMKPQWSRFRIGELFTPLRREFEPMARDKGLSLVFVPSSATVRSDRRLLRRLLQNLVSNAIKYTRSGRVLVGVRRRGARLSLEVWDTGLGIPASKQALVFREFQRLEGAARIAPGVGLGLSIVERIARVLDDPLSLTSEVGRGSVFRVLVPRAAAVAGATAPESRGAGAPLSGMPVLAIDNEPAILDGLRALLTGWGCRVTTAASAGEALAALDGLAQPIEVVLADYHLDDGDGLAAIAALRAATSPDLAAILVTADRSPAVREGAAASGVHLLHKPLKPAALRALLAQWRSHRIAAE